MINNIAWIAFIIFMFVALILMVTICFLGKVSGQYFDSEFKKRHLELPWATNMYSTRRTARSGTYLLCLLLDSSQGIGRKIINTPYNQINYRKLARRKDWILGFTFWGAGSIFILALVVLCIVCGIEQHLGMIKPG